MKLSNYVRFIKADKALVFYVPGANASHGIALRFCWCPQVRWRTGLINEKYAHGRFVGFQIRSAVVAMTIA